MCVLGLARGEVYTGPGCFPSIPPGRCRQPEGRHVEARGGFLQDQLVWYPRTFTPDPCSLSCCARPCYQVLMRASEAVRTRKGGGGDPHHCRIARRSQRCSRPACNHIYLSKPSAKGTASWMTWSDNRRHWKTTERPEVTCKRGPAEVPPWNHTTGPRRRHPFCYHIFRTSKFILKIHPRV